jgi:hypothetical protein
LSTSVSRGLWLSSDAAIRPGSAGFSRALPGHSSLRCSRHHEISRVAQVAAFPEPVFHGVHYPSYSREFIIEARPCNAHNRAYGWRRLRFSLSVGRSQTLRYCQPASFTSSIPRAFLAPNPAANQSRDYGRWHSAVLLLLQGVLAAWSPTISVSQLLFHSRRDNFDYRLGQSPSLVVCRNSFGQIKQTIGLMNDVANVRDRRAQNAAGIRNRGK